MDLVFLESVTHGVYHFTVWGSVTLYTYITCDSLRELCTSCSMGPPSPSLSSFFFFFSFRISFSFLFLFLLLFLLLVSYHYRLPAHAALSISTGTGDFIRFFLFIIGVVLFSLCLHVCVFCLTFAQAPSHLHVVYALYSLFMYVGIIYAIVP